MTGQGAGSSGKGEPDLPFRSAGRFPAATCDIPEVELDVGAEEFPGRA
ncbi:hypothetical protein [Streptomyces sp. XH2]